MCQESPLLGADRHVASVCREAEYGPGEAHVGRWGCRVELVVAANVEDQPQSSQTAGSGGRCRRRLSNCAACDPDHSPTLLLSYLTAVDQCLGRADGDDLEELGADVCTERRQRRTYNGRGFVRRRNGWGGSSYYSGFLIAIITIVINCQHPGTAAEMILKLGFGRSDGY